MQAYILRRLALAIPTLFIVTLFVFILARLVPGSVIDLMIVEQQPSDVQATRADIMAKLGLDQPIQIQYFRWVGKIFRGDLGESVWTNSKVTTEIVNRVPISMELGIIALFFSLTTGITLGIFSAIRQDTLGDYVTRTLAITGLSLPQFWVATLVVVFPAIWWGWSPPVKYTPFIVDPWKNISLFIIPGLIMGLAMSAGIMRMTRTMMLEVLRQDYIRTAWSKGLKEKNVILRHAIKNALIPVVTMVQGQIVIMLSGSVVMETIFNLPGMGRLMVESLNKRDYTVISGINLVVASFIIILILIIDISYSWLDPRIRYQ
jgi:peptide/nickel transport system permease protein